MPIIGPVIGAGPIACDDAAASSGSALACGFELSCFVMVFQAAFDSSCLNLRRRLKGSNVPAAAITIFSRGIATTEQIIRPAGHVGHTILAFEHILGSGA